MLKFQEKKKQAAKNLGSPTPDAIVRVDLSSSRFQSDIRKRTEIERDVIFNFLEYIQSVRWSQFFTWPTLKKWPTANGDARQGIELAYYVQIESLPYAIMFTIFDEHMVVESIWEMPRSSFGL